MRTPKLTAALLCVLAAGFLYRERSAHAQHSPAKNQGLLPTGQRITPQAIPNSHFEPLNPELRDFPHYLAGQAVSTALSPDGRTLLILTSGFNRIKNSDDKQIDDASEEYVFVYDVTKHEPRKTQTVKVSNTFVGLAFAPDGRHFYVSGGKDDNVHVFARKPSGTWQEDSSPIPLAHPGALGLVPGKEPSVAGGLAITADGAHMLVANVYNDSVTLLDLARRKVIADLDLRPGKIDAAKRGIPGGEYPYWVATKGNATAYVSSLRDREVIELELAPELRVVRRIAVRGNPNKMILNRGESRLFVAADNSDAVSAIDTQSGKIVEEISTTAPNWLLANTKRYTGSSPNSLALSPDEQTLYVTNGGTNSVAVIRLRNRTRSQSFVAGLLPTGWSPNSVTVSKDGQWLYVVNGKSAPGPNPLFRATRRGNTNGPGMAMELGATNQYIYQLEKAGFLSAPLPARDDMDTLTRMVGRNNNFSTRPNADDEKIMAELRGHIKHVIYIVKENRTYDQILGDLPGANGDASLTEFGRDITPNFHRIAGDFVALDNFYNSGEVSGDGWPWSTSGRQSEFGIKATPLNYASRGTQYEYEGPNRDINVGLATLQERREANAKTPDDADLLPGTANVAEPDGPASTAAGKGYIWDAVLRAGLTFREYGAMSDMAADAPREPYPFKAKVKMQRPANPELYKFGDPYYRGFDPGYPDFYREAEWEREFADYEKNGKLPNFELVQLCTDHMGDFKDAISEVDTPEKQQADNDYAVARLVDRVAHSRYAADTLIFIIEDDSQDGADHVDAHRTTAYVVGPYVKHSAVVSTYYTTVSMIRTMEDVLGLEHLNLNTAMARPMTEVFDLHQKDWTFAAKPSNVLTKTKLPLDAAARAQAERAPEVRIAHPRAYWAAKTEGMDFRGEDRLDAEAFNRIIWEGLKGR